VAVNFLILTALESQKLKNSPPQSILQRKILINSDGLVMLKNKISYLSEVHQ